MVSKAAATTFERGPIDKVVTGDPNKISTNEASNLLPVNVLDGLSGGALGKLIKKSGIGGSLSSVNLLSKFTEVTGVDLGKPGSLVSSMQGIVDSGALDPDVMKKRMKDMGMNLTRDFDKLGGDILSNALKSTGWIDDATAKNLFGNNGLAANIKNAKAAVKGFKLMVDDVETFVKDIDFGSVTGVSNLITTLTGNSEIIKVLGIQDKLAGLKLINDIASVWGVPKLADRLLGTLNTDEERTEYLLNLSPTAINNAHLENIQLCIDKLGANFVLAQYPGSITTILQNYSLPIGKYLPTHTETALLVNLLKQLDPNWATYSRQGVRIFDLEKFANASDIAKRTLALDPEYQVPATYALINSISSRPISDVLKEYYTYY